MYNVGMKDKELRIRMDSDFEQKVEYLKEINGYKNKSDTIRRTVEKEFVRSTVIPPKVSTKEMCEAMERLADIIVEEAKGERNNAL